MSGSDVALLGNLLNLKSCVFSGTHIKGIDWMQLRECQQLIHLGVGGQMILSEDELRGIAHLKQLMSLTIAIDTGVTADDVEQLRKSLPNCHILLRD